MTIKEFNEFVKTVDVEKTDKMIIIAFEGDIINSGYWDINARDLAVARQELEYQAISNMLLNNKDYFKERFNKND